MTRSTRIIAGLIVAIIAFAAILSGLVAIGVTGAKSAKAKLNDPGVVTGDIPDEKSDFVVVYAQATSLDVVAQSAKFSIYFDFSASLAVNGTHSAVITEAPGPINITVGNDVFSFKTGAPMFSKSISVPVYGDTSLYPFDSYYAEFPIFATFGDTSKPLTVLSASLGSPSGFASSYDFATVDGTRDQMGEALFTRSKTTRTFAILISLFMWGLSLCASSLSVILWVGDRKVEPPHIIFTSALLFALPGIRSAMPGAPAIGAMVDQLVLVWCMSLLCMAEVIYFLRFIWANKPVVAKAESAPFVVA
ncbi:hypothetical protein BC830DRAFT_1168699 [Chytriomyces sp. MP71]|nr:hypothetical protein BC830DRAFT_1168699 [Chytriomyces sp. MP71]